MRCNPSRWLWGLIPLFVLALMALFAERSRIETDLSSRAQAALKQEGYSWASIKFDGRDAIVQGLAYSDDHPGKAGNVVGTTWGVRVVENKISLVEKTQRFFWRAAIRNNRIKLSGFVPSDAVRSTVVSLVKADFPDREVDDQLKAARGSPSQDLWLGAVTFALKQLANLKEGQVALEGLRLSIAGESASYPKFKALKSALAGGLPKGAELASDGVRPPKISPFTWAAAYNGKQLTIAGHAPSEDARTRAFEWAKRSFPKAAIVDRSEIADGGPREWSNAVQVSLSQLAYLNQGSAKLRDQSLIIDGVAEKEETADSVKIALRNSLLSSVKLTHDIKFRVATPRPVSPFVTSIAVEPSRIDLTGYAPGASSKAVLIGAVAKLFPDYAVSDRLQLAAGASNGWQACLVAGLDQLKRAGNGRLILTDQRLQMMATLVDEDLAEAIKGDLRTNTNRACETETKFKLVLPPEPSLNWSARRDNEEAPLLLSGEVPSEAAMTEIEAAAVRLFPSIKIANQMRVASGGPTKRWLDTATVGLAMLAKLRSGEARLNGTKLTVTGVARDAVSAGAVRDALTRTLAKGYSGSSDLAVKSDAMIWAEMEAKRKAEADRKAEENRAAAEAQARRNAEEDARRKAEEEARSKAAAEAKRRQAEVEARRQAEQAAQRRADEEARKRAAEEAERQRAGEEARRRLIEDARRQVEEEEARRRAAESAQALAIAEARRKAEEEARKRADEEARRLTEARRRAEEEARQQAERRRLEEERRQKEERALARARTSVDACQDVLRETAREGVIRFARSSADLEDASRETVERLARVANACPTARIEVEGHTDSDGRTANNQRLSERRAEALVRALVAAGVAADRLSSVGYGPSRPVAPNDTAENKAKNRRIEFTIKTAR